MSRTNLIPTDTRGHYTENFIKPTDMKLYKVKFPKGEIGHEICHYMGVDHAHEKSEVGQSLVQKVLESDNLILNDKELTQLIHEVEYAIDIKQDHINNSDKRDWTSLKQYQMGRFLDKLVRLRNSK